MTQQKPAATTPATTNKQQQQDFRGLIPWKDDEIALLKATVARGADLSNAELAHFARVCSHLQLDPLRREIYAVRYEGESSPVTFQTAIDGFRKIARRTGKFDGYAGPTMWCGEDGEFVDVWTRTDVPPTAARVGVRHADFANPIWATALYKEYVATRRPNEEERRAGVTERQPNSQWTKRPAHMLAKCAEALAMRMAFPDETVGLYEEAEMAHVVRADRATGEIIDSTAHEVPARQLGEASDEAPDEAPELFGSLHATIDDLTQLARTELQRVNGNLSKMRDVEGWPAEAKSMKGGLAEWARPRTGDVVTELRDAMRKAFAPQQPAEAAAQQSLME